ASRTAKGLPIVNVINMQPDETVTTLLKIEDFKSAKFLFFTTRQGTVKRVSLDQFQSVRSNGMIAITLDAGDELAWVKMTSGED
ncbi:DNA gyrase subunit A, partial [Xanthomonas citri pv. citri]|nr:DNA gyrase subunit A [Xanthomonas citri pv. citri]